VGGVLSVLHSRLLGDGEGSLLKLTGPLMSMIVLPYLGAAAAQRESARPIPAPVERSVGTASDPLRDLRLRLTYRTIRVLMSVAAHPGSSNRDIGLHAGIADQGQISKLLSRLHRLGLIHNTGIGPTQGRTQRLGPHRARRPDRAHDRTESHHATSPLNSGTWTFRHRGLTTSPYSAYSARYPVCRWCVG
jgi:hypothetical protein